MSYKPSMSLPAFFTMTTVITSIKKPLFGTPYIELFQFIFVCLDAYIKGTAVGYTFRNKYNLLAKMMGEPSRVNEFTDYLYRISKERVDSYEQEITSIIDFFISTELSKGNLNFDDLLKDAKSKVKMDYAEPIIKFRFEEGTAFGAKYPKIVSKVLSPEGRASSLDWNKAKRFGLAFDIKNQELNLDNLQNWAMNGVRAYAVENFPELVRPLAL
jgi:hypothetical protein